MLDNYSVTIFKLVKDVIKYNRDSITADGVFLFANLVNLLQSPISFPVFLTPFVCVRSSSTLVNKML